MISNPLIYPAFALLLVTIPGCANTAIYRHTEVPSNYYQRTQLEANQHYLVDEPLAVQKSLTPIGRFNAQIIFMADQIERNADRKNLNNTFIVTSFTDLNKLSETTPFGRLVAENLIHELQVRKWKVYEVRLTNDVIINETGEFSLSRDIKKIKELYKAGGIVTGTYSKANNHVIVNARVMDINTGLVASSGQAFFPGNRFTDSLLFNENSLKAVKIVGDTPYSCRDNSLCWNGSPSKKNNIEGVEY